MPVSENMYRCYFKSNGTEASETLMHDVSEIIVDNSLHLPDMFTFRIYDEDLEWVDASELAIGSAIEVLIREMGGETGDTEGASHSLIKGEITAVELDLTPDGRPTLLVRGYDRSHRLHRGKKTRTFANMSDSQIVQQLAGDAGLSAQVDSTSTVHTHVYQDNQTNLEFLLARAHRIGYQVYVDDRDLHFRKGDQNQGSGPELVWRENLLSFRPRLSTFRQVDNVTVKGWDPKAKAAITGEASSGRLAPQVQDTPSEVLGRAKFGSAEDVVVNRPVADADEAKALAQALFDDISGDFIHAEGVCLGDPRLKAGVEVAVQGVSDRFSGTYFVTSATHLYRTGRYEVAFRISGRQPNVLSHLLKDQGAGDRSLGVAIGLVTNIKDPEEMGRVKVKFPWLEDSQESTWMRILAPMAGPERGFYFLPEVNDEVLVVFEHNSFNHPFVLGALWNGKDKVPQPEAQDLNNSTVIGEGVIDLRIIRSRAGHEIVLNDTDGKEQVVVYSKGGHRIVLDDSSGSEQIIIRDKTSKNEIIIDSAKNDMNINVANNLTIEAKGNITIKSQGQMQIESTRQMQIQTRANMTAKSTGNMTIQATGKGEIQSTMLSINGGPITEVKGGLIKLN